MKLLFFLFCFALVFGQVDVRGQVDRSKKPTSGPTPPLGLPNIQRAVLKNGLKVMLVEYHQVPMVQFNLVLATGTTADPDGKPGTANLTTRMIDEGRERVPEPTLQTDPDFI